MTDLETTLTVAEADLLAMCEETIERGLKTFVEVGKALMQVRDNRLYREHGTFEDYCAERFGISRTRAYQLMDAADVVSTIVDKIEIAPPSNEAQTRELAKVPEADRAEVWTKTHEQTGGNPTAAAVRNVANPQTTDGPPSVDAEAPSAPVGVLGDSPLSDLGVQDGGVEAGDSDAPPQEPESPAEETALFEDEESADRRRDDELDNAMDGTATRFRRNFGDLFGALPKLWVGFDPERVAEVYARDFDHTIEQSLAQFEAWAAQVRLAHRRQSSGLRLVAGGRS